MKRVEGDKIEVGVGGDKNLGWVGGGQILCIIL